MGRAAKVTVMVGGFMPIAARLEVAVETDDSNKNVHTVCTGVGTKHSPTFVKQRLICPACDRQEPSVWQYQERGEERAGGIVVLTAEELDSANGTPITGRGEGPFPEISFHSREKVYACTVAADSVQNMSPDKGGEKSYALLRDYLAAQPDVVGAMTWAPSTKNALWVLEVVDQRIVVSKRCWPEDTRPAPAIAPAELKDREVAMFALLAEPEDFDIGKFVDQARLDRRALLDSKGDTPAAATFGNGDVMAAMQAELDARAKKSTPKVVKKAPAKRAPAKKAVASTRKGAA